MGVPVENWSTGANRAATVRAQAPRHDPQLNFPDNSDKRPRGLPRTEVDSEHRHS